MSEELKKIIQNYLGMTPKDKGCTNWEEMNQKMLSEIEAVKNKEGQKSK